MKYCQSCGMPLTKKADFAKGDEKSILCCYCVDAEGNAKSAEEIFEGGVQFFMNSFGGDRQKAERLTRKNMSQQPYWKNKNCKILEGEMASDEEFKTMLAKM